MSKKALFLSIFVIIIGSWCSVEGQQLHRKCKRKPSGTILRSPSGCNQYYECTEGVPKMHFCPKGTLYSAANPPCEVPEKANCVDGSVTRPPSSLPTPITSEDDVPTPLAPTTVLTTPETTTSSTTDVATIAKTYTTPSLIVTTRESIVEVPTTRTTRRRRTRTTPKTTEPTTDTTPNTTATTQITMQTTTPAMNETSSDEPSTSKPVTVNPLERSIKCPDNETANEVAFVPSNMDCTK